jgi:hypothetical protein
MKQAETVQPASPIRRAPGRLVPAPVAEPATLRARAVRLAIFAAGVVATHFVLFAPSLVGAKVLLPLDDLAFKDVYLPKIPPYERVVARHPALSDQVFQFEMQRRFAAEEIRAGRVPLWDPHHYCGAPFVVPYFSPYNVPYYAFPHYVTLAWTHVLVGLVAAGGAYVFFRRVLGVGFWPAVIAAWCYPLTGFFQLWLGFYLSYTASFFPWLLVAVDAAVRRPGGWGGPALAAATAALLVSGAADLAGQALLASGLFALWRMGQRYAVERDARATVRAALALTGGWALGFLLAAPYLLPLLEYMPTGLRIQRRASNVTERPPVGLSALPQMVLPYIFGALEAGWVWMSPSGNLQESGVQAYAGLFAALVLLPIGFTPRRLRALNVFWVLLGILSAAWVLNLWPLTAVLRLPGLNLMSHNRFLFVLCFVFLALAAVGLDAVARGTAWRPAFVVPIVVLVCLGAWSAERAADADKLVRDELILRGAPARVVASLGPAASENLRRYSLQAAAACAVGVALWAVAFRAPRRVALAVLGVAMVAELLWFDRDQNPQSDPAFYFPRLAPLAELAEMPPGRVAGFWCLPPTLGAGYGFRDLRGYDAVDPARIVSLLYAVRDPDHQVLDYAMVQWWLPRGAIDPRTGKPKCLPVLNMLNLRYIIGRREPPPNALFKPLLIDRDDYWVYENPDVLPRAFVPRRVAVLSEPETFRKLTGIARWQDTSRGTGPPEAEPARRLTDEEEALRFDPRAVAYVASDLGLRGDCHGSAEITAETPCEVHVAVDLDQPGLLVLADQWYPGWKAYLDGKPVPVVPANYAIRGVPLPAGRGEVVFRYEPTGWARGLAAFAFALPVTTLWAVAAVWCARRANAAGL